MKKGWNGFSYFVTAVFLIDIASSAFVIVDKSADASTIYYSTTPIVCFIKNNSGIKYYTSLNKALTVASGNGIADEIVVVPGLNKTLEITKDQTIIKGDTFILPYEADISQGTYKYFPEGTESDPHPFGSSSANPLAYTKTENRKVYVEVKNDSTITNYGTIYVAGKQNGGQGGHVAGNTTGLYSELKMTGTSSLINTSGSKVYCYGYISSDYGSDNKPTGSVIFQSGSYAYTLFTIGEHRGGNVIMGMADGDGTDMMSILLSAVVGGATADPKVFPFNRFYIDNLRDINFQFQYGSEMVSRIMMYANSQSISTDLKVIGTNTDYILGLKEGSSVEGYFKPASLTSNDVLNTKNKMHLNLKGDISLGNIKLDMHLTYTGISGDISVSSADIFLPLSHYYDIVISKADGKTSSTFDATGQSFKLLPGSSLKVEEGVTLKAKQIAVYPNSYFYPNGTSIEGSGLGASKYPSLTDAYFEVDGSLNSNGLGGFVYTNSTTSVLEIASNQVQSLELIGTHAAKVEILGKSMDYNASDYNSDDSSKINAEGYIGLENVKKTFTSNYLYSGEGIYWSETIRYKLTITTDNAKVTVTDVDTNQQYNNGDYIFSGTRIEIKIEYDKDNDQKTNIQIGDTTYDNPTTEGIYEVTGDVSINASSSCLSGDSMIAMADGSVKRLDEITYDDDILAWNLFEGKLTRTKPALLFKHEENIYDVLTLNFSDGTHIEVLNSHRFFDFEENDFVTINAVNYNSSDLLQLRIKQ